MRLLPEENPLPRLLAFVYLATAALAAGAFYFWGPLLERAAFCPWRRLIGLACPTCGGTHMALALVRLDLAAAIRFNPLLTIAAGAAALWIVYAVVATCQPRWRRQLVLSRSLRNGLRLLVLILVAGGWIYQILRP